MTDSGKNGWGITKINIEQDNVVTQVFGLASGSISTQTIQLVSGKNARVRVEVIGSSTQEVGFKMTDPNGAVHCSRVPGYTFASDMIFCEFCAGCGGTLSTQISYTLSSKLTSGKGAQATDLGYNGTVLGIVQNGEIIEVGSNFTSRSSQGPINLNLKVGSTIQLVAVTVPSSSDTEDMGYTFTRNSVPIIERNEKKPNAGLTSGQII